MQQTHRIPELELGKNTMSIFKSISEMCSDIYKSGDESTTLLTEISLGVGDLLTWTKSLTSPLTLLTEISQKKLSNISDGLSLLLDSSLTTNKLLEDVTKKKESPTPLKPNGNSTEAMLLNNISYQFDTLIENGLNTNKILHKILKNSEDKTDNKGNNIEADFLSELKEHTKLLKLLTKGKGGSDDKPKPSEGKDKKTSIFDTISGFATSIESLAKNLTVKFIKNFDKFTISFEKLLNSGTEAKLDKFSSAFENFSKIFSQTGQLTKQIFLLSLSFFALTLAFASPMVLVSIAMFSLWVNLLTKMFTNKIMDKGIKDFAMGIALLTLSMFAMEYIEWTSGFKMLAFVGGLGFIFKFFKFDKVGTGNPIVMVATAIAILTLTMFAMEYISWESGAKMLIFVAGLGLIFKFFKFDKVGGGNPIILVATALAIMTLTLFAMEYIEWGSIGKMLAFVGGLGLIFSIFKFSVASKDMLILSFSLGVFVGVLWLFTKIDLTYEKMLQFGLTIAMFGLVYAGLSFISAQIGVGAVAMALMFGSLLLGAISLWMISQFDVDKERIYNFMLGVGIVVGGFALLVIPAVLGLVGAVAFIPIAIASLIGGLVLAMISALVFTPETIKNYMMGVGLIIGGFALLTVPAVLGLVGALAFIPIAMASLLGALVLTKISQVKVDNVAIDKFIVGVTKLVEGINEIGAWDLAKTSAKAVLLYPILKASWLATNVLTRISENASKINVNAVTSLGGVLVQFVDTMVGAIEGSTDKIEGLEPALNSISKMLNIVGSLGKIIGEVSNLNFNTYGVKDGRLVLTGTRKLEAKDFDNVGKNIMVMLNSLIKPLNEIGNGTLVTDQTEEGMDIIKDIADAFKPLVDVITKYANLKIATDPKLARMMSNSLLLLTRTIIMAFSELAVVDMNVVDRSISNIKRFMELFKDSDQATIQKLDSIMNKFVNTMSSNKWNIIHKNLKQMQQEFVGISKAVNSIDLQKAMTFERTVKTLATKQNSDALLETVQQLKELLMVGKQTQVATEVTAKTITTGETPNGLPVLGGLIGDKKELGKTKETTPQQKGKVVAKPKQSNTDELLIEGFNSLTMTMNAIASKLGGNLKMIIVEDNSNGRRI